MDRGKILIVEDDEGTRRALRRFFKIMGYDVVTAGDVASALDSLGRPPDLAILDLALPDGDGEEVLRALRGTGYPTRVVVCTGTSETDRLKAIAPLGPVVLLLKPIDLDDVFSIYSTMLERPVGAAAGGDGDPSNAAASSRRRTLIAVGESQHS